MRSVVEITDYLKFVDSTKEKHLQAIKTEEVMEEVNAGACPWWNISCNLGNTGSYCTLSVECMPSCH